MLRMRLVVVVMLLAVIFALPAMAAGPTLPRLTFSFGDPADGKTVYVYTLTNFDSMALTGFKLYAPLGAGYITAYAHNNNDVLDLSWTSTVNAGSSYSEIIWQKSGGLPLNGTVYLKLSVPDWTTPNPTYAPPMLYETNWMCQGVLSPQYYTGSGVMPVPEGPVPEPASLVSLASLGVLLVGAAKRRK